MSESTKNAKPHFMQTALDNQWLMLFLGLTVPTVIYTLWGLWDVIHIPMVP